VRNTKYIEFTEEEKIRANETNLVEYLQRRGENIKRVGKQYVLEDKKALCIYGFKWFDHYEKIGGNATSFLKYYYGYEYKDAVIELLGEHNIQALNETNYKMKDNSYNKKAVRVEKEERPKKEFKLPTKNRSNDRLYSYLQNKRFINNKVLNHFVLVEKLYQEEKYNNIIFIGVDEENKPKFASAKGSYESEKGTFKQTLAGSNCNYSFNHIGKNEKLYVFEAPVDMLSYLSLNIENWKESNYIALDGTAMKPLNHFLKQNEHIKEINLCLDNEY